jgi:hypothetical protein
LLKIFTTCALCRLGTLASIKYRVWRSTSVRM